MKKFNLVVCGGTFDHFHKGHETFLKYVFFVGKKIIIGLTSDEYVEKSKIKNQKSKIESFEKRKDGVLKFLGEENISNKAEIIKIDDLFGPTLSDSFQIDAIVVSKDTQKGAEIINQDRKKRGLSQLKVIVAPIIFADSNKELSSFRIRNGEINREGNLYVNPLWLEKNLMLPENLRKELKKPFGELFKDVKDSFKDKNSLVITVGDITTKTFNDISLGQNLSIIDFKVARETKFSNILELGFAGDENIFKVDNPAGYITSNLFITLAEIFK